MYLQVGKERELRSLRLVLDVWYPEVNGTIQTSDKSAPEQIQLHQSGPSMPHS